MPKKNVPQSYGSQSDWVTGKTGQTVAGSQKKPADKKDPFYEEKPSERAAKAADKKKKAG